MSLLDALNPQQREAVLHGEGPLLLLAGAGSGKTRVITTRAAYLIVVRRVPAESILAVTFTNKAAQEMRERVGGLLRDHARPSAHLPTVATFHAYCVRLLRSLGAPLAEQREGFTPDFLIFDESDQRALLKTVYREIEPGEDFLKPRAALAAISRAKCKGGPSVQMRGQDAAQTRLLQRVYEAYQAGLMAANALDFDDLLLECVRLLESRPEVRDLVRARYRFLMVDEFQDTNRPQYELLRLLALPRRNVCVVGDEDQAIYSWRGAEIGNILDFERDFPGAKVIRLEQNYRSTRNILAAASAVVEHNQQRKGKTLWSDGPAGSPITVHRAYDGDAEARYVARALSGYLDRNPDSRAAVLYRTNAQSRLMEEALRRTDRDFVVVAGLAFYERAEVKDLLAYLKAAAVPEDAVSLRRILNVPARGIGKATLDRLERRAAEAGVGLWRAIEDGAGGALPLARRAIVALYGFRRLMCDLRERIETEELRSVVEWIFEESGYRRMLEADGSPEAETRLENVQELLAAASEASARGETLRDFLDHAALVSDADAIDKKAPILLMTLHNAKGLEFPVVAMVGLEENLLPHARSLELPAALEEERRLCYVGMTRAEQHLLLTYAEERRQYGAPNPDPMLPSRFLREIPPQLVEHPEQLPLARAERRPGPAPVSKARRRAAAGAQEIKTYDNVEAVAGFFKNRGVELEPAQQFPAAGRRAAGVPDRARGPVPPKLGESVMDLRRRGAFARGTRVRHQKFGVGTVQRRDGEGPNAKLTVHFQKHGLKRLVAGYANLQQL